MLYTGLICASGVTWVTLYTGLFSASGDLGGEVGVGPAVLEVEPPELYGGAEVTDDSADVTIGCVLDDSCSSGASVGEFLPIDVAYFLPANHSRPIHESLWRANPAIIWNGVNAYFLITNISVSIPNRV